MTAQFGPSALATPANLVTVGRLLLSIPFLTLVLREGPSWPALAVWVLLCASDGVDGYLARRQGTTRSGAFLDPLADKVLVLGALVALVAEGVFWWVPVALVTAREIGIQAFRSYWGRRGLAVPATLLAKAKTVVQELVVGLALTPTVADQRGLVGAVLWVAVALTLVSGAQYVAAGSRTATTSGSHAG